MRSSFRGDYSGCRNRYGIVAASPTIFSGFLGWADLLHHSIVDESELQSSGHLCQGSPDDCQGIARSLSQALDGGYRGFLSTTFLGYFGPLGRVTIGHEPDQLRGAGFALLQKGIGNRVTVDRVGDWRGRVLGLGLTRIGVPGAKHHGAAGELAPHTFRPRFTRVR
jgi:hypothetical protein